mgnify:CR=1 FL=1
MSAALNSNRLNNSEGEYIPLLELRCILPETFLALLAREYLATALLAPLIDLIQGLPEVNHFCGLE